MAKEKQNINDVALSYMEQKYNEKFEYSAPYGNSMTGTHQLLVQCAGYPGENILVRIENYKHEEERVFLDNYLAVKYRKDTTAFLLSCANQVFGESTVFYDVANQGLSPDLPVSATLNEFLADTRVPLNIMIEVKVSNFTSESQAQLVAERIAAYGTYYYLSIVILDDSVYGTHNNKTLEARMATDDFIYCAKITRLDDEIQIRWLEKE
jgi:hypothetical protein